MFISVKITRSSGKVVKSFTLIGAHNLEKIVLWIWRDLFITVLATGTKRQRSVVPDMMDDIRILLGWRALEQLLRGGTKGMSPNPIFPSSFSLHYEVPVQTKKKTKKTSSSLMTLTIPATVPTLSTTTATRITFPTTYRLYAMSFIRQASMQLIGHGVLPTSNHDFGISFTPPSSISSKSHPHVRCTIV